MAVIPLAEHYAPPCHKKSTDWYLLKNDRATTVLSDNLRNMTKGSRRWPGLPIRISAGTSPIHGGPPTGHRASAVNTTRHLGAGIHRLDLPWHIHITSHDLCSLSHSSGHSWAVFTVWQVALSYWGETAIWVLLPWAIVLGLQQFLRWWCVSSGIHINARTQGYQAEHCLLRTWSILFTSLISGFNVFLISVFRHSA